MNKRQAKKYKKYIKECQDLSKKTLVYPKTWSQIRWGKEWVRQKYGTDS